MDGRRRLQLCTVSLPAMVAVFVTTALGCRTGPRPADSVAAAPADGPTVLVPTRAPPELPDLGRPGPIEGEGWESLFDGKTLDGWRETPFGGFDEVHVMQGCIVLDFGTAALSGITRTRPAVRMDYELEVDAMRVEGSDFFCGLTFPYGPDCCSLIVGGWGGNLIGISSFDGLDASENETTRFMEFASRRWYRIRVRVAPGRIRAWIDGEPVVDARPGGRRVSVRFEVEPSQPLGIAAWHTRAAIAGIRQRAFAE